MTSKRMFSKQIVSSDAFTGMPLSAQALYFHLNLWADDDGFVDNPQAIRGMIGANEDDLKLLIAKRFVMTFETGIIVIKHWKIHNYIRKDRYKETIYLVEKNKLYLDAQDCYTEDSEEATNVLCNEEELQPAPQSSNMDNMVECENQPVVVDTWLTQERVGEGRLDKISIDREGEKAPAQKDIKYYGKFKNLKLTTQQYDYLKNTYKEADKLVDKVSCIIENTRYAPKNPFAYIIKIGISDGFEEIDADEAAKQEEKEKRRKQQRQEMEQQMEEEWYRERMTELNVSTREEVDEIAHQKFEHWRRNFGK